MAESDDHTTICWSNCKAVHVTYGRYGALSISFYRVVLVLDDSICDPSPFAESTLLQALLWKGV
jgi:hypothetical protein